ncbi:uncharacterized protein LOC128680842 isoform X2 [Plodia interpunctella]|uniref:uncharacterized protein LOC128680842 isoform X2 n=1 Tax=Plodia interpunctella TaxID=58824 RepID=UPI0023679687|nr:uncharacterized protein LOC128680842 isoform X2 [Plodia interpunctella]
MVLLTGENLGKKQQDLNKQVFDAASRKADFEQIKNEPNSSDVDVLFKIDLASKYKNVDYILEMLKSGDSLYISRALKCTWLYDDEYSNVINSDYLHHNIFPSMSAYMKRKFLTTISIYLRNKDRTASFYIYCVGVKLHKIALKFLIFTSEIFKLNLICHSFNDIMHEDEVFYRHFVGDSFTLAEAIMQEASEYIRSRIIFYLRYLISVSENDYLDLMEKYDNHDKIEKRFGLRISKLILKKHRNRYLEHPLLYMERLNKDMVTKNINVEDTKYILRKALPEKSRTFWQMLFCIKLNFVIDKIPSEEKFQFIKSIFNEKYPNENFEMSKRFLELKYYELMTANEKEAWALRHIEFKTEILGLGRNYQWYRYVNFGRAFPEIKKYILITPDVKNRHNIVEVLIKSVRNQRDMQALLSYYYDRHVNEQYFCKDQFVTSVINEHNIFEFDKDCWAAFNKILSSMNVYKTVDACNNTLIMYTVIMYHIIHEISLPEVLQKYILENNMTLRYDIPILYKKIDKETQEKIYDYIANIYVVEITKLINENHEDINIEPYVQRYIDYLEHHKKSSDYCPSIIMEFVNTHWSFFCHSSLFKKEPKKETLTEAVLLRHLKKDPKTVIEKLPQVKDNITENHTESKINTFLKKIKIYYPDDITKEYYNFFMKTLTEIKLTKTRGICNVVYGILQLADDRTKIDFVTKYAPTDSKINHDDIDEVLLGIQESICRYVCFTRPPVPVSYVLKYVKGDYLKSCLPMFQSYQATLPQPLLQEFVISLIDTPVSIQKHALRLVFQCFTLEALKNTVCNSWKGTKNVSLRFVLYQSLYNKICDEDEIAQVELFEVLKKFTSELNEDDNNEIFDRFMTSNKLPNKVLADYIKVCWQTVSKFPDKTENYHIKARVIYHITASIKIMDPDFVKEIVEEHINYMLARKNIRPDYKNDELDDLNGEKWKLVATYIIYFSSDINYIYKNMDLVRLILAKCVEMWNVTHDDIFTCRQFCWGFINDLISISTEKCCSDSIPIFECILKVLEDNFPLKQIYKAKWALKLTIMRRKAKQAIKVNYNSTDKNDLIDLIRTAMYDYGMNVANLVKENVDKNTYFVTANNTIADMIKDNIDNIMSVNIESNCGSLLYESMKSRYVLAAGGLTEVNAKETYLLALYILPMDSNDVQYNGIVDKIENFDSEELSRYPMTC